MDRIWRAMISRVRIRPSTRMVVLMAPPWSSAVSTRPRATTAARYGANTRKNARPTAPSQFRAICSPCGMPSPTGYHNRYRAAKPMSAQPKLQAASVQVPVW